MCRRDENRAVMGLSTHDIEEFQALSFMAALGPSENPSQRPLIGLKNGRNHHPRQQQPQPQGYNNANQYMRTCNDLFGASQLATSNDGKCLTHSILNWVSCNIGSVWIDTGKIEGSLGGEPISDVLDRSAEVEFLKFTPGSLIVLEYPLIFDRLSLQSVDDPVVKSFLNSATLPSRSISDMDKRKNGAIGRRRQCHVTLFVRRPTYANPCMAMIAMYNVYIVLQHFLIGTMEDDVCIIWLDGHAQSKNLDDVWEQLFHTKPLHIKQMGESRQKVENAIIVNTGSAIGDEGMGVYGWEGDPSCSDGDAKSLNVPCNNNSTLVSFRNFVLDRYGITRRSKQQSLESSCRLTFLFRKDYFAHPRSNGHTDRTLANRTKDLAFLQSEYPSCSITAVSFEEMTFEDQLKIVSQSDVFVSVHGAGNIHVLFLPDHALFVEYFPKGFDRRRRFQYLSECLNLSYQSKKAITEQTFADRKISVRLRRSP
eukprot:scaffold667_cov117-Cylindrotheca_fusiformis.AAC.11